MIAPVPLRDVFLTGDTAMSRPPQEIDTDLSYANAIAARLRELRKSKGWEIKDVMLKLAEMGHDVAYSTLYSYERAPDGARSTGSPLPLNMIPIFAELYGFKSPHGWLP